LVAKNAATIAPPETPVIVANLPNSRIRLAATTNQDEKVQL